MTEPEPETVTVVSNRDDAVRAMRAYQAQGWDIYATHIPLSGQAGFKCVSPRPMGDGPIHHLIYWNMFQTELTPIILECDSESVLLSYILRHGRHESFGFFMFPDDDLGFVCYCEGHHGRSNVLHIPEEHGLDENAEEFLGVYLAEYEMADEDEKED